MAIIGLSSPFAAKYNISSGVYYTEGRTMGKAVEYSLDLDRADDVALYDDGAQVSIDPGIIQSGTLTVETTGLSEEFSAWLLNLITQTAFVAEGSEAEFSVTEYLYGDEQPLTVGIGLIETHQIDNVQKYKTIIFSKCLPIIPNDAATTRGERIDWQTPKIEFIVERSDASDHTWKREAWHQTQYQAEAYLAYMLGDTDRNRVGYGQVGYMKVV